MSNSTLLDLVRSFGEAFAGNCRDMVGADVTTQEESLGEKRFTPSRGMTVMIHYTGVIQGEFAVSLDEDTAARLIGSWSEGMTAEDLKAQRIDFGGFLKEALNTSVGMAIPELEKQFDALTFLPPVLIFGDMEYPDVPSGFMTLSGSAGEMDCYFVLNMMGLELGDRLQAAIQALGTAAREASAAKRSVESMLEAFPQGLVTVDRAGIVQPGYASQTAAAVGLAPETNLAGMKVAELLGFEPEKFGDLQLWIEVMHDRYGIIPFRDLVDLCPISEDENSRGILLHLSWVALPDDSNKLDGLLLMLEDVTEKRRIEKEMKHLSRLHEENVELVTQIVNLEADEIQDFVYDSNGLLQEAQKIVHSAKRDRQFIEKLYRAVHTLKGNSGQFQFKGLQKLAMEIESNIAQIRDQSEFEDGGEGEGNNVRRIEEGLEEAENYIRRVEEMRAKLGSREEGLEEKAERAVPTVMVPLASIDTLAATVWGVREAGRTLGWSAGSLQLLGHASASAARLREVELARIAPTMQGVVEKLANKLGKKARFSLVNNVSLDIDVLRDLHHCFVHLVNNSLDHGLEKPEDRLDAGKLDTGVLALSAHREGHELVIRFSDDGRGIHVASVREKLIEKGMEESEVQELSDEAVLDKLFESGFSTRAQVTDVSGRGVGLDMVRATVEGMNGTVVLESVLGKGSTFTIRLPLQVAQPSQKYIQVEVGV